MIASPRPPKGGRVFAYIGMQIEQICQTSMLHIVDDEEVIRDSLTWLA
ncbi:MAG: hypothetical protein V7642_2356, partial [Burkholderiales bacterium]